MMFPTYWRCDDPPPSAETPSDPPSTQKILRHAAATIHADGAGIYKQPPHVSYTNKYIPTLVSVTNPTQTHVINLLGHDITITLTTTWSGTATNPFTGETQTINGLVTTKETTGPFPLGHLTVSNTDTWEEKQGH